MARKHSIVIFSVCTIILGVLFSSCAAKPMLSSVAAAAPAEGGTLTVHENDNLQEVLDSAEDGSTVAFSSGVYNISEPLRIEGKKSIVLRGMGDVKIYGDYIDKQIFIIRECGRVELENIRACHKSSEGSKEVKVFEKRSGSVVDVKDCLRADFTDCEFEGCGVYGIYTENVPEVGITGCYIHHNSWKAFGFHGNGKTANVTLKDSTVTNNADFVEKDEKVNLKLVGENVIKFNNVEGYKSR